MKNGLGLIKVADPRVQMLLLLVSINKFASCHINLNGNLKVCLHFYIIACVTSGGLIVAATTEERKLIYVYLQMWFHQHFSKDLF